MEKVIIYGTTNLAKIIFTHQKMSPTFDLVGFTADAEYVTESEFLGLPLCRFDEVETHFPKDNYRMLVVGPYKSLRARGEMFQKVKDKGYVCVNFIEKSAQINHGVRLGENNIIFGNSYLDCNGTMADNNLIRPNTYIGHDFNIGSHNYIAPGCTISGFFKMKDLSFLGVGTTVIDHIEIENESLVGAGSLLVKNTEKYSKNIGSPAKKVGEHKDKGVML